MGIQIFMEVKDLLTAHCSVEFIPNHMRKDFHMAFVTARVSVPNTKGSFNSFTMSVTDDLKTLWSDYNEWGFNRERISPFIHRLNIPHIII